MKANARQMRKAKRGKRVGEKEGNEKGKQPGRRRPPSLYLSLLFPCVLPVCPLLAALAAASGQLA